MLNLNANHVGCRLFLLGLLSVRGFAEDGVSVSALLHPATYLNKVLVACARTSSVSSPSSSPATEAFLELWNVRVDVASGKIGPRLVHRFDRLTFPARVTLLCQAPAVDVIAAGVLYL